MHDAFPIEPFEFGLYNTIEAAMRQKLSDLPSMPAFVENWPLLREILKPSRRS